MLLPPTFSFYRLCALSYTLTTPISLPWLSVDPPTQLYCFPWLALQSWLLPQYASPETYIQFGLTSAASLSDLSDYV